MSRMIVTEGPGDVAFFKELISEFGLSGFQVFERKPNHVGSGAFQQMLESLSIGSGFGDVSLAVVVADCDLSPEKEFRKVVKQIRRAGDYAVPTSPRNVASEIGKKSTSVLMLPWDDEVGALETVCYELAAKKRPKIARCVEAFIDCAGASNWNPQQLAKLRLRCVMSASCPKDPNTGLQYAWTRSKKRPKELIPVKRRLNAVTRIVAYLKGLP